jgi:hypothetical protein
VVDDEQGWVVDDERGWVVEVDAVVACDTSVKGEHERRAMVAR